MKHNKTTHKTALTIKEYKTKAYGYDLTIPVGSIVNNNTANGCDDNYRFLTGTRKLAEEVTGFPISMLQHDLEYYGLNIPQEYCEEYKK